MQDVTLTSHLIKLGDFHAGCHANAALDQPSIQDLQHGLATGSVSQALIDSQ